MADDIITNWPRRITIPNLSARARVTLCIAIVTPLLLIGMLHRGAPPGRGLAGCTFLSTTRHVTAADFPRIRARFARSHWRDLRLAGTAYADLLTQLRTSRGTDGYEAVWFYQRLTAACARHGRALTQAPDNRRPEHRRLADSSFIVYRR
jgi:hypothetical protein